MDWYGSLILETYMYQDHVMKVVEGLWDTSQERRKNSVNIWTLHFMIGLLIVKNID